MAIDFLLNIFQYNENETAFIINDNIFTYQWLIEKYYFWLKIFQDEQLPSNSIVAIESDYNQLSISLLLALIKHKCIIIPLTTKNIEKKSEYLKIAKNEYSIQIDNNNHKIKKHNVTHFDDLLVKLKNQGHPGLILFSSGTSGKSKAAVHDFRKLLLKYQTPRKNLRTIAFMNYDHIGGIDTLFYSLSNGSSLIIMEDRNPDIICKTIQNYKVEVLPVTPTFLNLLLISGAYKKYDLTSIKYITYGTEVMSEYTLKKISEIYPNVNIIQKYGTTEVGTLRSKSESSDSLWVKLGGEGYQTRIVDGILQIKAESSMLGYLNAPSPFTHDGWFNTGDSVIEKDGFLKILGRKSELINVGGEKVYPAEVESVIQEIDNVSEVTVYGEPNQIMGNIVCAQITPLKPIENNKEFKNYLKTYCSSKLENFKIPIKIKIINVDQHSDRFKKNRIII